MVLLHFKAKGTIPDDVHLYMDNTYSDRCIRMKLKDEFIQYILGHYSCINTCTYTLIHETYKHVQLTDMILRHILERCECESEEDVMGWLMMGCKYIDKVVRLLQHAKVTCVCA